MQDEPIEEVAEPAQIEKPEESNSEPLAEEPSVQEEEKVVESSPNLEDATAEMVRNFHFNPGAEIWAGVIPPAIY